MAEPKAKTNLQKMGFLSKDKKNSKHDIIQTWVDDNAKKIISETIMKENPHPFEIKDIRWEHQVMHTNGSYSAIVGFIDLKIHIKGKFYYWDTKQYENSDRQIFIEVKTEIPNLGELIRQMRTYQTYADRNTHYLIVSPDDRHTNKLKEQGFYFYKYQDPTLLF